MYILCLNEIEIFSDISTFLEIIFLNWILPYYCGEILFHMSKNAILATKTKMDAIGIFPLDGDGGGPPDPCGYWHVSIVWSEV